MPPLLTQLVLCSMSSPSGPLDLTQFEVDALCNDKGLERALEAFQECVEHQREKLHATVQRVMDTHGLFEWLVFEMSERSFATLRHHFIKDFPDTSLEAFYGSPSRRFLMHSSDVFTSIALPYNPITTTLVEQNNRRLSEGLPLLEALRNCCVDGTDTRFASREVVSFISSTPFDRAGVAVPQNLAGAWKLAKVTLGTLKDALKIYFTLFRDGSLAETFRNALHGTLAHHRVLLDSGVAPTSGRDDTGELPLSHKKAVIILDTIEGFGSHKITITSRMIHHMRSSRSRPRLFTKINEKLRQLSHGQLSGENGILLTSVGGDSITPVYAAKVFSSCAIVYYVSKQEIRVFGVYRTESTQEVVFWNSVGEELSAKGVQDSTHVSPSPKDPEMQERIRALVVLNKCVELSVPVLRSIMADDEVHVALELSPAESEIVYHEGSCYVLGRSGTGKTTVMLYKMLGIECSWSMFAEDVDLKPRQLFVTRSQHLADKVKESFARLYEVHVVGQKHCSTTDSQLYPSGSEISWVTDLPDRFGQLKAEHFPLFVSFEQLRTLLEDELGVVQHTQPIRYEVFLAHYWSSFPVRMTEGLDPFQVFGEFIGIIKGSERTIGSPKGYLDRSTYMGLSNRAFGTFADQREIVYSLFELYLYRQRVLKQTDIADRTHMILRELRDTLPRWLQSLDFIYVDEAQDNLLIDALLLRLLCKNSEGLFWAGDTAQTIFAGNSFTFNELRSFFHRIEELQGLKSAAITEPRFFKLSTNFRSQAGIVLCGQSILHLVGKIWPASIDQLPKEANMQGGIRPLFFRDGQIEVRNLNLNSSKTIEFGAEQCILVRDEGVRDQLAPKLHHSTLILTLYESKGLEFNDVIIFNFFQDSQVTYAQWKTLRDAIMDGIENQPDVGQVYNGLLAELKCLYVAITRARQRLWIIDSSERASRIHSYWASRNEIETAGNDVDLSEFAIASDSDAWDRRGRELLSEKRYRLACQAFRTSGNHYEANIAQAFELEEQIVVVPPSDRGRATRAAANAFMSVAVEASQRQDRRYATYCDHAASCYLLIPDIRLGAKAYVDGGNFNRALRVLRDAALFDDVVELMERHPHGFDDALLTKVTYATRLFYVRELKLENASYMFDTPEEVLRFAEIHGLQRACGRIIGFQTHFSAAAEHYLERNYPVTALKFYHQASEAEEQPKIVDVNLLLDALWREPTFSYHPDCASNTITDRAQALLDLVDLRNHQRRTQGQNAVGTSDDTEVALFKTIATGSDSGLLQYHQALSSMDPPRLAASFLALSHHLRFDSMPTNANGKPRGSFTKLTQTLQYVRMLSAMRSESDPVNNLGIQRLMGIRPVTTNRFHLLPGSVAMKFLAGQEEPRQRPSASVATEAVMEKVPLEQALAKFLSKHLISTVSEIVRKYRTKIAALPESRQRRDVQAAVQMVALLIMLYDVVRDVELKALMIERRRLLIDMFYDIMMTVLSKFGRSSFDSMTKTMPAWRTAAVLVMIWISDYFRFAKRLIPLEEQAPRQILSLSYKATAIQRILDGHARPFDTQLLRQDNLKFVQWDSVQDLMSLLRGSLPGGVLLFTNIVYEQAAVDVSFLCDMVDLLVAGFSLASWQHAKSGTLLAQLPLGCSPFITRIISRWLQENTGSLDAFLWGMKQLVEMLSHLEMNEWLYSAEAPVKQSSAAQRDAIGRILRSLVIMGMNIEDSAFRRRVIAIIRPLRNITVRAYGPGNLSIVRAEKWEDISAVSWKLGACMIIRGEKTDRIDQQNIHILEMPRYRDDIGSEYPCTRSATIAGSLYEHVLTLDDLRIQVGNSRFQAALTSFEPPNERLQRAATSIQRALHAARAGRQHVPTTPLAHLRLFAYQTSHGCHGPQAVPTCDRPVLFGPLPHARACLAALKLHFRAEKEVRSSKLRKVGHGDLEEAGARVVEINEDIVEVEALEEVLRQHPESIGTLRWQKDILRALLDFEVLFKKVPQGVEREHIREEWALVKKAIPT